MTGKAIFKPELSLELTINATHKKGKLTVKNSKDVITIVEGIKELAENNLMIIYLDSNEVIIGIESFMDTLDKFNFAQSTRAMSSVIVKDRREVMSQIILAQFLPKESKVNAQNIGLNQLAIFGYKLLLFGIELRDCILIGTENHFSFKEDSATWNKYRTQVDFLKDLTSGKDIDIEALQKELKNKKIK